MSKRKKAPKAVDASAIRKRLAWQANVAEMRDGRRQRASTFVNRRKEADRKACRGKVSSD